MMRRVRWSPLVITLSPMMMRSPGFSSTLRPILASANQCELARESWRQSAPLASKRKRRGIAAPPSSSNSTNLAEQAQHLLVRLRGERQGNDRELLTGLQRRHVGTFLVGVGQRQVVG